MKELTSSGPLCFFDRTFIGSRWRMAGGSLSDECCPEALAAWIEPLYSIT
jgi:hypothetical protein